MGRKKIEAIDFFCSGGGMSCGMQQAGIKILGGIDIDANCKETYESNIRGAKFINADILEMSEQTLQHHVGITTNDDNMLFIGCSPCQYWSIMRTNRTKSKCTKNLLCEFLRFILYYQPGYVLVENVPGILNKEKESKLDHFIQALQETGYTIFYKVVNLNDYGVPQSRKRFTLIANRVGKEIEFPKTQTDKPTVRSVIGDYKKFPKIPAGHKDILGFMHTTAGLSNINIKRLKMTPANGGTREVWADTDMQLTTYKKNNVSFKDTYGRMFWDKPAPTITTKFFSISNGRFVHPEQNRAISLREGATLQTFPLDYKFVGTSIASIAKMIGNAVPPNYAKELGIAIGGGDVR